MEISINYVAVLVAAIMNMVVGMLWYGPMFGRMWKGLMGYTDESMKSMKMTAKQAMVGGFITALLMAYVLAHFVFIAGVVDIGGAFQLAFWLWLGFMVPLLASSFLWEGKPMKLFVLNAAQYLVSLFLMAVAFVLF